MRMRKKPNLIPRMERCAAVQVKEPETLRGKWLSEAPECRHLHLEIGCGKGRFTAETAKIESDALLVAVERVPDAMVVAMERVCADETKNVRFIDMDAAKLAEVFAPGEVERIYLNFSDPWPRKGHAKRRLTSPGFLAVYKEILRPGGEIHFKTDNNLLFEYSVECFEAAGWRLSQVTRDLHENGPVGVMTDFEEKFVAQGMKINRLVAARPEEENNG